MGLSLGETTVEMPKLLLQGRNDNYSRPNKYGVEEVMSETEVDAHYDSISPADWQDFNEFMTAWDNSAGGIGLNDFVKAREGSSLKVKEIRRIPTKAIYAMGVLAVGLVGCTALFAQDAETPTLFPTDTLNEMGTQQAELTLDRLILQSTETALARSQNELATAVMLETQFASMTPQAAATETSDPTPTATNSLTPTPVPDFDATSTHLYNEIAPTITELAMRATARAPQFDVATATLSASPTADVAPILMVENLSDAELMVKLDEYFGITSDYDEGDSLFRLGGFLTDSFNWDDIVRIEDAISFYGDRALQYVKDRAPLYEMIEMSVEGAPGTTVHMGLHNPNFNLLNSHASRLGFGNVFDHEGLSGASNQMLPGLISQDGLGNITIMDSTFSDPNTPTSAFSFDSSDGKDRLMLTELNGYEQMAAGYHLAIANAVKTIDTGHLLTPGELHDVAQTVTQDLLTRHFSFESRTFAIYQRDPSGINTKVAEYAYPDRTCLVQDGPDQSGGNPFEQNLMALEAPVRAQNDRVDYGTSNEKDTFTDLLVIDYQQMAGKWDGTVSGMVSLLENNIQGFPVERFVSGEEKIAGSFEISPENHSPQAIEKTFWNCAPGRGERPAQVATVTLMPVPQQPPQETSKPGETPKPGDTPQPSKTPEPTPTLSSGNLPTTAPTMTPVPEKPTDVINPTVQVTDATNPTRPASTDEPIVPTSEHGD